MYTRKKRAISTLVIAILALSFVLPLVGVSASPDVVVTGTSAYYEWTIDVVKRDFYSLHVTFPLDVSVTGIDVIATPTVPILLSDITEIKFWEYVVDPGGDAGYTDPPPGDIEIATGITLYLDMNLDGVFDWADDAQIVLECPKNDPLVLTNLNTWDERDAFTDGYTGFDKGPGQLNLPGGDITYWKTSAYSTYEVISIGLVLGWGNYGNYEGYLDDITVNGVTYPLTINVPLPPTGDFSIDFVSSYVVDYGDTLTVTGSGVTAGSEVKIFWDYASGTYAHLLNTTEGNPDGTFDLEVDVPSDTGGAHYLWATDVSTGETISSAPLTMVPRVKLSPSSGLVGDEVTIKGYGFTAEANFTSLTFGAVEITETPEDVETDEDGYFTYTFDVPDNPYKTYAIRAEDFYGFSASKNFVLGASITLDPEEGPTGIRVEVEGRGFTDDETISFTMDSTTVHVVDDDVVTVKSDGTFSAEIIIPDMDSADEYEITATESGNVKGPGYEDFEVDGVPKLVVDPTYGTPGATITVTGSNFTQIAGTEVTVKIGTEILVTAEIESDGTFEDTFISPAILFTTYDVVATDEYGIDADDSFKVGLIALIINPEYGEAGTRVSITGIGFAPGDYNVTFGTKLYEEFGIVSTAEAISDLFYVPNVEPGFYYMTIIDTDDNELTRSFMVTDISTVVLDPAVAPNEYNVSVKGYNFADVKYGDVDFVLYNYTEDGDLLEWPMEVWQNGAGTEEAETGVDGNFTGWWLVDPKDDISLGDYTVNVTGPEGLLVQVPFSVVEARVSVAPRKAEFDRGDMIQFDIENDFNPGDSYIEIYDPYDTLYWSTDKFVDAWWLQVGGLYTVPYYRQTAAENPMELQSDAPMGAWLYIFYDEDDEQLMNGTFSVGPSTAAQVEEKLTEIWGSLDDLTENIDDITDEIGDDLAALSGEIDDITADVQDMIDDITADIADDLAQVAEDTEAAVSDLEGAIGDIAAAQNELASGIEASLQESEAAREAAEESKTTSQGLTTLVYGAIGASLIAALAAIVSLMQISKKIA